MLRRKKLWIILTILIIICISVFVMVHINQRWVEIPFDYFGCLSKDTDYRSPDGKPIETTLCWYSLSEKPYSERGPDKEMYKQFEFDFDNYTYIVCQGYKLKSFKYRQPLFGEKRKGYAFCEGFAELTLDGLPNTAYIYRIPKMWVEPKWNSNTIESDSMIVTKK